MTFIIVTFAKEDKELLVSLLSIIKQPATDIFPKAIIIDGNQAKAIHHTGYTIV